MKVKVAFRYETSCQPFQERWVFLNEKGTGPGLNRYLSICLILLFSSRVSRPSSNVHHWLHPSPSLSLWDFNPLPRVSFLHTWHFSSFEKSRCEQINYISFGCYLSCSRVDRNHNRPAQNLTLVFVLVRVISFKSQVQVEGNLRTNRPTRTRKKRSVPDTYITRSVDLLIGNRVPVKRVLLFLSLSTRGLFNTRSTK